MSHTTSKTSEGQQFNASLLAAEVVRDARVVAASASESPFVTDPLYFPHSGRMVLFGRDWMLPETEVLITTAKDEYFCQVTVLNVREDGICLVALDVRHKSQAFSDQIQ